MATVVLTEFSPLTHILQTIPRQAQKAFSRHHIEWTCLDASCEYIAIGTDFGVVYLYNRQAHSLQRLHLKNRNDVISCVKLQSSVDYVVGVGTKSGHIYIFQLPSTLAQRPKELQQFIVQDVHQCCVTCVEWSQNAMKLFSSDDTGVVVCTEIDYTKNESRSYVLCTEADSVIQLQYSYRILLISSRLRTVLCLTEQDNRIVQVGTKPRKSAGAYGATFVPGSLPSTAPVVLAARPGLRLWRASGDDGVVSTTYLLRDSVPPPSSNALHLLGCSAQTPCPGDRQLGVLLSYDASLLVSWHGCALYLIDPGLGVCIGCCGDVGGRIIGVATCDDEVFVLKQLTVGAEGHALIRLAQTPDCNVQLGADQGSRSAEMGPVDLLEQTASTLVGALRGVSEHFQFISDAHRISSPPPNSQSNESLDSAREASPSTVPSPESESCTYSPVIVKLPPEEVLQVEIYEKSENIKVCNKSSISTVMNMPESSPDSVPEDSKLLTDSIHGDITSNCKSTLDGSSVGSDEIGEKIEVKSENCSTNVDKSDEKVNQESIGTAECTTDKFLSIGREEFSDVLFSSYNKKPKRKKKVVDKDAVSITDASSTTSAEDLLGSECIADKTQMSSANDSANTENTTTTTISMTTTTIPMTTAIPTTTTTTEIPMTTTAILMTTTTTIPMTTTTTTIPMTTTTTTMIPMTTTTTILTTTTTILTTTTIVPMTTTTEHIEDSIGRVKESVSCLSEDTAPISGLTVDESELTVCDHDSSLSSSKHVVQLRDKMDCINIDVDKIQSGSDADVIAITDSINIVALPEDDKVGADLSNVLTSTAVSIMTSQSSSVTTAAGVSHFHQSLREHYTPVTSDAEADFYARYPNKSCITSSSDPTIDQTSEENVSSDDDSEHRLADTWTALTAPDRPRSVCVTLRHVWCVDVQDQLHYAAVTVGQLKWRPLDVPAHLVAVSPSGGIVWRLYAGSVYVAVHTSVTCVAGTRWVEVLRSVSDIAVDDNVAWYVKQNGEVGMQKALSRERPSYRSLPIPCPEHITHVACYSHVVWALSNAGHLLLRTGVDTGCEEGDAWSFLQSRGPCVPIACFDFGPNETAWVIDANGTLWFTTDVTKQSPGGSTYWWQVSLSKYLVEDSSFDTFIGVKRRAQHFSRLLQRHGSPLISARHRGIWICSGDDNVIHVCRGSIVGHRWELVTPGGTVSSVKWLHIDASMADNHLAEIWSQQPNGGIFCFSASAKKVMEVAPPVEGVAFTSMSCAQNAVWGLLADGRVFIRGDMTPHCIHGRCWLQQDMAQLGSAHLVHVCCGTQIVLAVDTDGQVYLRIGTQPPSARHLSPAWVPIDGTTNSSNGRFTRVYTGSNEWMIWALDNNHNVYVRKGITEQLPIGTHWLYVAGTPAVCLCVSEQHVYAVNQQGDLFVRHGISLQQSAGDYWRKIPGNFASISVTSRDELWAINACGQLYRRYTSYQQKPAQPTRTSVDSDWELI